MGLTRKQVAMLAVLVFGSFVTILNQTLITPAQPTIMREMSVDASTVQWLTTAFTLVNAVMIPVTAYLTDRFTTRRLFSVAMSIFTVGAAVVAVSPNFSVLLLGRVIQAAGAGIMMPMSMTVLLLTFPTERRGTAMGLFGVVMMLAPAIGPTVSGLIIDRVSWHYMFYAIAALALVCVVLSLIFMEDNSNALSAGLTLDKPSVITSTLGFGGVLYGLSVIGSFGVSAQSIVSLVVGALILVYFFRRQLKLERPMLEVRVLKTRKFLVATVIGMVVQASIMANGVLIPIYVQTLCGQSAAISGLVMLPGALLMGVMSPVAGRLFDKHGPRALALVGMLCLFVGTVAMTQVDTATSMALLACIIVLRNLGMTLVNMPLNTWGINALDNKFVNHGTAVGNTFRQVAGSFGCALVISVYSLVTSSGTPTMGEAAAQMSAFSVAFWVQVALVFIALAITFLMVRDKPTDALSSDANGERKRTLDSVMHKDVYTLMSTQTVADGIELLLEKGISAAPVVDEDNRLVAFFSDGDVVRAISSHNKTLLDPVSAVLVAPHLNPDERQRVKYVLSSPITTIAQPGCVKVDAHEPMSNVCRIMGENHLKKVPVVENDMLVGVVNRSDVIRAALSIYRDEARGGEPAADAQPAQKGE